MKKKKKIASETTHCFLLSVLSVRWFVLSHNSWFHALTKLQVPVLLHTFEVGQNFFKPVVY